MTDLCFSLYFSTQTQQCCFDAGCRQSTGATTMHNTVAPKVKLRLMIRGDGAHSLNLNERMPSLILQMSGLKVFPTTVSHLLSATRVANNNFAICDLELHQVQVF